VKYVATQIIVPLDMSETAESALPFARTLATQLSAQVSLISVIEVSPDLEDFVDTREYQEDVVRLERDMSQYLDSIAATFEGLAVDSLIRMGSPVNEVAFLAENLENPVLVMASHGRSGFSRHLLGSVTMRTIHEVGCPVFVVSSPAGELPVAGLVKRVLVPLDGSELAEGILDPLTRLFGAGEVELCILRVSELGTWRTMPYATLDYYGDDTYYQAAQKKIDDYLGQISQRLILQGHRVSIESRDGSVSEQIRLAADEKHVDLIAMATHGRTGLNRLIMGSEAERVLRDSLVPVLLQRPSRHD
jgi:nucleotide-binding universal stress UspA family protein